MVVSVLHISWKDAKLTDVAPHGNTDVNVISPHNSVDPDGQTPNTDPRSVHDDPDILALTNAGAERYEDEWNGQQVHDGHKREGRIHHLGSLLFVYSVDKERVARSLYPAHESRN